MKMTDVGSSRKFSTSSFESFWKVKKKRIKSSVRGKNRNRIDGVVDRDLESRAIRICLNCAGVPLKSSRHIYFGVCDSVETSTRNWEDALAKSRTVGRLLNEI